MVNIWVMMVGNIPQKTIWRHSPDSGLEDCCRNSGWWTLLKKGWKIPWKWMMTGGTPISGNHLKNHSWMVINNPYNHHTCLQVEQCELTSSLITSSSGSPQTLKPGYLKWLVLEPLFCKTGCSSPHSNGPRAIQIYWHGSTFHLPSDRGLQQPSLFSAGPKRFWMWCQDSPLFWFSRLHRKILGQQRCDFLPWASWR